MTPWALKAVRPGLFLTTIGAPSFARWHFDALARAVLQIHRDRP